MAPKVDTPETYFVILREGVSKTDFINTLRNNLKEDSTITIVYEHVLNGFAGVSCFCFPTPGRHWFFMCFAGKFVASDIEDLVRHPDVEVVEKDSVGSIQDSQCAFKCRFIFHWVWHADVFIWYFIETMPLGVLQDWVETCLSQSAKSLSRIHFSTIGTRLLGLDRMSISSVSIFCLW